VAREFKRRVGDTTPILLGGVPYSAEALTARLLRAVVDEIAAREGGQPDRVCISHPANWGPYKTDLLLQAVRLSGLPEPVSFTTEPEAAAVFYAQQQRVEPGAIVAVYDLGGGTFDAAVLRKTPVGFEILGRPEGIERLGGIDFDAAVFSHVARALGGKFEELDENDPTTIAAVARLRDECIQAKEALSSDTDVSIPVLLPNISTEIRLTRAELEAMVRPALHDSIEALKRALRTANVTPDQLHSVLLVGGSSRMPIVAQLVGAELGRPVAVDAHPKHAVALGASWLASGALSAAPSVRAVSDAPAGRVGSTAVPGGAAAGVAGIAAAASPAAPAGTTADAATLTPGPAPAARSLGSASVGSASVASTPRPARNAGVYGAPPAPPAPPRAPAGSAGAAGGSRPAWLAGWRLPAAAAAVAVLMIAAGTALALTIFSPEDTGNPQGQGTETTPVDGGTSPAIETEPALPADEQCTDAIKANPMWVCITGATINSQGLEITYDFLNGGAPFSVNGGFHVHFYGANEDGSAPPDSIMGSHASNQGQWYIDDQQPSRRPTGSSDFNLIAENPKVCARIANGNHGLVPDNTGAGTYKTGNCWPITRT
jgi:actin-like ATPase involved in cell morphogenesis